MLAQLPDEFFSPEFTLYLKIMSCIKFGGIFFFPESIWCLNKDYKVLSSEEKKKSY